MASADGLVVVDKPAGRTSHDVVAAIRRLAGTRRVGHAGTLDPMATGVLVLGVGRATRLLGHLMLTEKGYDATIRLGVSTDSDDADGAVLSRTSAAGVSDADLRGAVAALTGPIEQVPSTISAVKIDGRRAYARVRSGEEVSLDARPVTVHSFAVLGSGAGVEDDVAFLDVDVRVACSSGTYVRALARDAGRALGLGGHLTALRRTRVGPYTLADAATLDQLEQEWSVMPLAKAAASAFPTRELTAEQARHVVSGIRLPALRDVGSSEGTDLYAMIDSAGELVALAQDRGPVAVTRVVFAPAVPAPGPVNADG